MSYGDPSASIFGIYFGGFKIRNGKTLAGSLGCAFVSSLFCCVAYDNMIVF